MSNQFSLQMNGQLVTGAITHRTHKGLQVEIQQPYSGYTHSSNIPSFSVGYKSFLGDYGDEKAKELLAELYQALYKLEDVTIASADVAAVQAKIKSVYAERISIDKPALRKSFKASEITQNAYQAALKSYSKSYSDAELKVAEIKSQFVQAHWPENFGAVYYGEAFDVLVDKFEARNTIGTTKYLDCCFKC